MKKSILWKLDLIAILVVIIGFQIIDFSLGKLEHTPIYYDFVHTAKWLLIGGFTIHGLVNWLLTRPR